MAARRNVLNGASPWEREERANQQRDYAAQLQQQVLQKQAKQEQEKARRQQEAREELELLQERERATATRKHHPQQEQTASETITPASSPKRAVSMPIMPAVELQKQISPLKSSSGFTNSSNTGIGQATEFAQHNATPTPATSSGSESYTPAFNSKPSIFESLLREPGIGARSTSFYDDLAGLQRLAVELDSQAKQRRTKAQGNYVKPNFLHQEEPTLAAASPSSMRSSVKVNSDKVNLGGNLENHQHATTDSRIQSDGLLGESMLLPLTTTMPFSSSTSGKDSPAKSNHHFSDIKRTDEAEMLTVGDLDNYSEMVRFGASEPWQEAR